MSGDKNAKTKNNPMYYIVMLGTGGVGKSALTVRYVQKMFTESYDPTIEDSYRKEMTLDNKTYSLEILDTAGADQFAAMKDMYMKKGDGFVLVYSVDNKKTFDEIEELREEVLRIKDLAKVPMMLVGNKCDLENREVTTESGQQLCDRFEGCRFIESSAKINLRVDEIYEILMREILNDRLNAPKEDTTKCACRIL